MQGVMVSMVDAGGKLIPEQRSRQPFCQYFRPVVIRLILIRSATHLFDHFNSLNPPAKGNTHKKLKHCIWMLFFCEQRWYSRVKRWSNRRGSGMVSRKHLSIKPIRRFFPFHHPNSWWTHNNFKSLVWRKMLWDKFIRSFFASVER